MMLAQVSSEQVIEGFGLPAAIVIISLVAVIVFIYRKLDKLQSKYDALQEQRIIDARETRDKVMEPLDKQAIMSEKIYELLLNLTNRTGK